MIGGMKDVTRVDRFLRCLPVADGRDRRQLRLEWSEGELTEVAEDVLTSSGPSAQPLQGKSLRIYLTTDALYWLARELGALVRHRDSFEERPEVSYEDDAKNALCAAYAAYKQAFPDGSRFLLWARDHFDAK
jgi:hypothetical protein